MRRLAAVVVLAALAGAPPRLAAQGDARVIAALRLAQDGRIDSARSSLAALETSVAPADSTYAQVLYAQGLVAPTVDASRQRLQRVVSEYPLSAWADDAVVRLAQLEYANGDPAAAARQLEKFHNDYATSSLFPVAAVWAGRSLLRTNDTTAGCRWVSEGLGRVGPDAATRTDLAGLQAKCGDRAIAPPAAKVDTPLVANVPAPTPAAPAPAPVAPPAARPAAAASPAWRVQIVVREGPYHKVRIGRYATRADATAGAARVKAQLGGQPFVVQDK